MSTLDIFFTNPLKSLLKILHFSFLLRFSFFTERPFIQYIPFIEISDSTLI